MDGNPAAVFQEWLYRRTGRQTRTDAFRSRAGTLDRYVEAHGLPERIISEPLIRVAAYDGRFVGEVRGTEAVLVFVAGRDSG